MAGVNQYSVGPATANPLTVAPVSATPTSTDTTLAALTPDQQSARALSIAAATGHDPSQRSQIIDSASLAPTPYSVANYLNYGDAQGSAPTTNQTTPLYAGHAYTLYDNATGKVLAQGSDPAAIQNIQSIVSNQLGSQGDQANWSLYDATPEAGITNMHESMPGVYTNLSTPGNPLGSVVAGATPYNFLTDTLLPMATPLALAAGAVAAGPLLLGGDVASGAGAAGAGAIDAGAAGTAGAIDAGTAGAAGLGTAADLGAGGLGDIVVTGSPLAAGLSAPAAATIAGGLTAAGAGTAALTGGAAPSTGTAPNATASTPADAIDQANQIVVTGTQGSTPVTSAVSDALANLGLSSVPVASGLSSSISENPQIVVNGTQGATAAPATTPATATAPAVTSGLSAIADENPQIVVTGTPSTPTIASSAMPLTGMDAITSAVPAAVAAAASGSLPSQTLQPPSTKANSTLSTVANALKAGAAVSTIGGLIAGGGASGTAVPTGVISGMGTPSSFTTSTLPSAQSIYSGTGASGAGTGGAGGASTTPGNWVVPYATSANTAPTMSVMPTDQSVMDALNRAATGGINATNPMAVNPVAPTVPTFSADYYVPTAQAAQAVQAPVMASQMPLPVKKAHGGAIGYAEGGSDTRSFAVNGPGTGRSDSIPAKLSDGEYVMDAETVALLGDGSSKAGADKLDQMRVNLRKAKGRNLAEGKFSVKAKQPLAYLSGGSV